MQDGIFSAMITKVISVIPIFPTLEEAMAVPILKAEAPKIEAIKNNPSMPPLEKAKELRAIHQQSDPEVKAILSPQQYEMWQQIRQQQIEQAIQK
jgi:hypothetical protein